MLALFAECLFGYAMPREVGGRFRDDTLHRTVSELLAIPADSAVGTEKLSAEPRRLRRRERIVAPQIRAVDTLATDTLSSEELLPSDTLLAPRQSERQPRPARKLLDAPITGKSNDSLVYDVRNKLVYMYSGGDVSYNTSNLKADYMRIDMNSRLVHAYGKADTIDGQYTLTKPEYIYFIMICTIIKA